MALPWAEAASPALLEASGRQAMWGPGLGHLVLGWTFQQGVCAVPGPCVLPGGRGGSRAVSFKAIPQGTLNSSRSMGVMIELWDSDVQVH